jgi:hypothetical protein
MVRSNLGVVFELFGGTRGNIDPGSRVISPVLGILARDLNVGPIDTSRQCLPEGVLDESRESGNGVLAQAGLVEDNALATVVFGNGKLLKEVGKHVGTAHVYTVVSRRSCSSDREYLYWSAANTDQWQSVSSAPWVQRLRW